MSSGGEMITGQLKPLLDRIVQRCAKISVAKKERLELVEWCTNFGNHLGDDSRTLAQHSGYADLKSKLEGVDGKLEEWSKHNYFKRWWIRKDIRAGIAGFTGEVKSINPAAQPTPEGSPRAADVTSRNSHESALHQTVGSETPESHTTGQSPPVRELDGEVTKEGEHPFDSGTYCETWIGRWVKARKERGSGPQPGGGKVVGEKVALKTIRMLRSPEMTQRAREGLEGELPKWAQLHHRNILPLYGKFTDSGRLFVVFPWREKGNLLEYVKKNPKVDKNHLLRGAAAGLNFLHMKGVVHGRVRCNNVLISDEGEAQVCDFGIAGIVGGGSNEGSVSHTVTSPTTIRYDAPELIENKIPATRNSDTYSFAMLILECITEDVPFASTEDKDIIHTRIEKKHPPPRPNGQDRRKLVSDDLWTLMNRCWSLKPNQRDTMKQVHDFFLKNS